MLDLVWQLHSLWNVLEQVRYNSQTGAILIGYCCFRGKEAFFEQCYDYNCSVSHQYTLQCCTGILARAARMQQCFPWEIALVLCECLFFFLFSADTPGSFKEAGFVASTIIFLEVAVIVCNPLLPLSACKGSWLVLGSPEKSDVIRVNQLRKKKKKTLLKADKTDDREAINALREHKQISWMFHQAATQIHLSLFPSQVFTQRSFVNFHETLLMPFGHHPWTFLLTAKRTDFTKQGI